MGYPQEDSFTSFEKEKMIRRILEDLPEWFGIPESLEAYIKDAAQLPIIVIRKKREHRFCFFKATF